MTLSQFLKTAFRDQAVAGPWRQLRASQFMTAAVGAMVGLLLHWPAQAQDVTRRIVVAGGDLTEIVFALDGEDQLVGVDQTSTWPPQAQDLPQIGYVRRLSAEGVLSLDPDLLIAPMMPARMWRCGSFDGLVSWLFRRLTWTAPTGGGQDRPGGRNSQSRR